MLIVVVFLSEAVLGLMSYVLQDRLEEDLGDKIMATMLENYQQDYLIQESVDKVQIEVPGWPETEEQTNISISISVPLLWCEELPGLVHHLLEPAEGRSEGARLLLQDPITWVWCEGSPQQYPLHRMSSQVINTTVNTM